MVDENYERKLTAHPRNHFEGFERHKLSLSRNTVAAAPNATTYYFVDIGEENPFNFSCGRKSAGVERSGVVGRTRWFISAPSLSRPLARVQRLRAVPVRQQCVYKGQADGLPLVSVKL